MTNTIAAAAGVAPAGASAAAPPGDPAGDEAGDAGQRVQREHGAVAAEHEAEVVQRSRAASARDRRAASRVRRPRSLATSHVAPSSSSGHGQRAERPRAEQPPRARRSSAAASRAYAASPGRGPGRSAFMHHWIGRSARPPPADATAAARSAGPEPARPPRARSARTSWTRRAGARGSGSAPRRRVRPSDEHAPGQLDLEGVALRGRASAASIAPQRAGAEALEAAGEVAHLDAEHAPRVAAARSARARAAPGPSSRSRRRARSASRARGRRRRARARSAAAGRPGRARGRRPSRPRSPRRASSACAKPGDVGAPEPGLAGPVQDVSPVVRASASASSPVPSRELSSTTRIVRLGRGGADAADDGLEVLGLVVGRQDHPDGAVHDGRVG